MEIKEPQGPAKEWIKDPIFHIGANDGLPDDHPLAEQTVCCHVCNTMLHHCINEIMTHWVEWEDENMCFGCFMKMYIASGGLPVFYYPGKDDKAFIDKVRQVVLPDGLKKAVE